MQTVVTHSGSFHPDDVFALAVLQIHLGVENVEIIRSRDKEQIAKADWVIDVGLVYSPEDQRFDHHQKGAPERENGIPYAAFGLVWKHFGEELCGSSDIAEKIDQDLVQPIDASDNGIDVCENGCCLMPPYHIFQVIGSFKPVWRSTKTHDEAFVEAVEFARGLLERIIVKQKTKLQMKEFVAEIYNASEDKSVLVFPEYVSTASLIEYEEVKVIVYPGTENDWRAGVIPLKEDTFEARANFPADWGALEGEELSKVSGIDGANFCHKKLFLFGADSKEGAIAAAKRAVEIQE